MVDHRLIDGERTSAPLRSRQPQARRRAARAALAAQVRPLGSTAALARGAATREGDRADDAIGIAVPPAAVLELAWYAYLTCVRFVSSCSTIELCTGPHGRVSIGHGHHLSRSHSRTRLACVSGGNTG